MEASLYLMCDNSHCVKTHPTICLWQEFHCLASDSLCARLRAETIDWLQRTANPPTLPPSLPVTSYLYSFATSIPWQRWVSREGTTALGQVAHPSFGVFTQYRNSCFKLLQINTLQCAMHTNYATNSTNKDQIRRSEPPAPDVLIETWTGS